MPRKSAVSAARAARVAQARQFVGRYVPQVPVGGIEESSPIFAAAEPGTQRETSQPTRFGGNQGEFSSPRSRPSPSRRSLSPSRSRTAVDERIEQLEREVAVLKEGRAEAAVLVRSLADLMRADDQSVCGVGEDLEQMLDVLEGAIESVEERLRQSDEQEVVLDALRAFLRNNEHPNSPVRQSLVGILHKYADGALPANVLIRVLDINRNLAYRGVATVAAAAEEGADTTTNHSSNGLMTMTARPGIKRRHLSLDPAVQLVRKFFDDTIPVASGREFRICMFNVADLDRMYRTQWMASWYADQVPVSPSLFRKLFSDERVHFCIRAGSRNDFAQSKRFCSRKNEEESGVVVV